MVARRSIAIVASLCSFLAFILSVISLLAGHNPNFLPDIFVFRLNTEAFGQTISLDKEENQQADGGSAIGNAFDAVKDIAKDAGNAVAGAAGKAIADALDIPDFYSVHLLTFCEGKLVLDPDSSNAQPKADKCSDPNASSGFDLVGILEDKLPGDVTLESLNLPDSLINGLNAVKIASRALNWLFIAGVALSGASALFAAFAFLFYKRTVVMANLAVAIVALLGLILASIIATVVSLEATKIISDRGKQIGVTADAGISLLLMMWAATSLMVVVTAMWVIGWKRAKREGKEYY